MTGLLARIAAAFAAELMELTADQRRSFNFHDASGDTIDRARSAARHALRAMHLSEEDWPDLIRFSDNIDVFNDTLDMALGTATLGAGDKRSQPASSPAE